MTALLTGAGRNARRRSVISVLAGALALGTAACSSAVAHTPPAGTPRPHQAGSHSVDLTSGPLPSFLPTDTITPDSMLTGTALKPAVTTEGDTVDARAGSASVRVRVLGPNVPGEGLPYVTPADTCTWRVTVSGASATVPLRAAQFTTVDEEGRLYHPRFLVEGHMHAPPADVRPGQRVTFFLRVVMPTGEGVMRWAPTAGQIVAAWDFVVEND